MQNKFDVKVTTICSTDETLETLTRNVRVNCCKIKATNCFIRCSRRVHICHRPNRVGHVTKERIIH